MSSGPNTLSPCEDKTHPGLAGEVVRFADFLKCCGFRVFQSSVHDSLRSLKEIDISKREDFFHSLRVNMSSTDLEWAQFAALFDEFWLRKREDSERKNMDRLDERQERESPSDLAFYSDVQADYSAKFKVPDKKEWLEGVAYSPVSKLEKKDLGRFDKADIQVAQLALKKMVEPFKIHISRRLKKSQKPGNIDFLHIMRKSLKNEGMPIELFYKKKKKRLKRLVILTDVSGSMDRYARFVMPFILGLRGVGSGAEVFVFSTSLVSVTFMVRHLSYEKALERIAREVPDWSDGTRIGYSLHQFNRTYGRRLLGQRTVVVILSDGWDLGAKELLRREMETLNRKSCCVIWLNPLAGDPDYRPVCKGMKIALPYVDHFLPADSLNSLNRVGSLLSRVMIR